MKKHPRVCIIVLNWNGYKDTIVCLKSLAMLNYPDYWVVVVDNGSTDGSQERIREQFPEVEIIPTGANLGFAGGNNLGLDYAVKSGAECVWLLNNDTIVQPDTLTEMVKAMVTTPKCGMVGSIIFHLSTPEQIWFAGGEIDKWGLTKHRLSVESGSVPYRVDFITGCSLLVSVDCIKEIGPMDEKYFMYYEDVEWCIRATRAGWTCVVAPQSKLWHKVAGSTNGSAFDRSPAADYYDIRNSLYFLDTYTQGAQRLGARAFFVLRIIRKILRIFLKGETRKGQKLKAIAQGLYDYYKGRVGKGWN